MTSFDGEGSPRLCRRGDFQMRPKSVRIRDSNTSARFRRLRIRPAEVMIVDECRQRGMTYAALLKVKLRLIVFDVDEETGARSVKDIMSRTSTWATFRS